MVFLCKKKTKKCHNVKNKYINFATRKFNTHQNEENPNPCS